MPRMWPDRRLIDLFGIELPIVQAPMAGAMDWELAAAAAEAGALGSLPCAMLTVQEIPRQVDSGFESEIGTLLRIRNETVRMQCPACGKWHEWLVRDAQLAKAA